MKSDESGITLFEVLITLTVSAIIGGLLLVVIVNTGGIFYKESSSLEQGLNINDALGKITQSIKEASAVEVSYPSGSPIYTSSATQLVLKVPSLDSSNNLISNTFDYFVFHLNGTNLHFKIFPDLSLSSRKPQDQIFSTNVNTLLFQYYNSQTPPQEVSPSSAVTIKTSLVLRQKSGSGFEQNTATTEANLRND